MTSQKFQVGERVIHWTGEVGTITRTFKHEPAVPMLLITFPDGREAWSDLNGYALIGEKLCIRKLTPLESLL